MKKTLLILFIIILINTVAYILSTPHSPLKKETVYIAVAGPMSEPEGEEMRMGINLYLDKVNKQGGINGKKIELLTFDDKNKSETAENKANEIAEDNKALVVLGHYYSSASVPAGKIYKKNEIPAINASGFAEAVTLGNEWYFRIVPNTEVLGGFAANYISKSLEKKSAGIIAVGGGSSGAFLAESFEETSRELGLKFIKTWFIDREKKLPPQVKKIVSEIKTGKPEIIFLATNEEEGSKIVENLKQEKTDIAIMGWHEIGTETFAKRIKKEYADGIYFISSFMAEIADENTYAFVQEYTKKYNKNPSWIVACYYDAAKVAVEAFKRAEIRGENYRREDRRRIRNALEGFYSRETGIKGVTGQIYFDKNGDINKPPVIGVFEKHERVPAFTQYRQYSDTGETDRLDMIDKIMDGELVIINKEFMSKVRLVDTGTEIIEAGPMDMKKSECPIDFYIWFRFSGDFNKDANIEFTNSTGPVKLGKPVKEEKSGSITKRTYRVKANFKCDFNFRDYPFDSQTIPIRFRHAKLTDSKLIYVPDTHLPRSFNISADTWDKNGITFFQDVAIKQTTLGNPDFFGTPQHIISYSQFNTEIRITRNSPALNFQYFFPITFMVMALIYVVRFAGAGQIRNRILSSMAVLAVCIVCQMIYFSKITAEYLTSLNFVFMIIYILTVISVLISVYSYRLHIKRKEKMKPGLWLPDAL